MGWLRKKVSLALYAACLAVSALTAVRTASTDLPNRLPPENADVWAWLSLRNLSGESAAVQEQIANQVWQSLQAGALPLSGAAVPTEARGQLMLNLEWLAERLFLREARAYAAVASEQRPEHLNQRLRDVVAALQLATGPDAAGLDPQRMFGRGRGRPQPLVRDLFRQRSEAAPRLIERWIQRAAPPDQEAMQLLRDDLLRLAPQAWPR